VKTVALDPVQILPWAAAQPPPSGGPIWQPVGLPSRDKLAYTRELLTTALLVIIAPLVIYMLLTRPRSVLGR
jgi:hypothetical protein